MSQLGLLNQSVHLTNCFSFCCICLQSYDKHIYLQSWNILSKHLLSVSFTLYLGVVFFNWVKFKSKMSICQDKMYLKKYLKMIEYARCICILYLNTFRISIIEFVIKYILKYFVHPIPSSNANIYELAFISACKQLCDIVRNFNLKTVYQVHSTQFYL